ncbi:transposase [Brevibacterium sp. PAMC21349]|nr:transposase [Brevibacterium sp. PAMC21349]
MVAFAGVDPSVHSSVKFTPTINRITKRGSRQTTSFSVSCRTMWLKKFKEQKA